MNQVERVVISPPGSAKPQPPELTPRDDVKKMVSEMLKRVDNLIRKGEFDQAEGCVRQARKIDPKNIYAYAFEERIHILKGQAQENLIAAAVCNASEEKRRQEEEQKRMNAITASKETLRPHTFANPAGSEQPQSTSHIVPQPEMPNVLADNPTPATPDPKDLQPIPSTSPLQSRVETQTQPDLLKPEEDRNLKIQRMIKIAVDAVRKEVEQKQSEIRAEEQGEILRREQFRIAEAAEGARRAEDERQTEIRKRAEERLLQRISTEYGPKLRKNSAVLPSDCTSGYDNNSRFLSPSEVPDEHNETSTSPERHETLSRYKLVLSSIWTDGAVSAEEEATLKKLRQSLSISVEEHLRLEKEVKRDSYIEAFKKAWNSGTITPENVSVLAELRRQFQISDEEHLKIESTLLWEIQPLKNRPTLLVVDDDERLLAMVSKTLNEAGFITRSVTTSDEAYAYLRQSAPDLILCDVNLETSTMGGFAFYEKVRELDQLRETPFIFLSGLTDEALVRTGKELGVDDYLSKPVSEETLVATIKGKLRRYHELKRRMN